MDAKDNTRELIGKQIRFLYGTTVTVDHPSDTDKIDNLIENYNDVNEVNKCIISVMGKKVII